MHDDGAMIRGRNARKRALLRSGVSITLSRLSDSTINSVTVKFAHFAGSYFISTHFNQPTWDNYWRVFYDRRKCSSGKI